MYLLVFEGTDCVGKTTLAQRTAVLLGAHYYKTPPEPYVSRRAEADKASPFLRFSFYLESMLYAMHDVSGLLKEGKLVVADRWIWSTLAYHFALEPTLESQWLKLGVTILQPDIVFFPYIKDPAVWLSRLREKNKVHGGSLSDAWIEKDDKLQLAIQKWFRILHPNMVEIENSGTIDQSVCAVLQFLAERIGLSIKQEEHA